MNITVPVYVESRKASGQAPPVFTCRPLFGPWMSGSDAVFNRALTKLLGKLKTYGDRLGGQSRHDGLAEMNYCPDFASETVKVTLALRDRQVPCRFLFVVLPLADRRVAFTPSVPRVWFELADGEELPARATEALSAYFREQAKANADDAIRPEYLSVDGQAWTTTVDVDVRVQSVGERDVTRDLRTLFDPTFMDGAEELNRVGRCLDWQFPDDLDRAVGRDAEVAELERLLADADNRPVILVGPRLAGKTTVIHDVVYRRVLRRRRPYAAKGNVWLLSPQRLISGMCYVGQWENRLLAILKVARRRRHVLYFDDVLGLYQAGISRDSNLSVADVLRPWVQRRELRVLAELTPERFAAFQERDRSLADEFHVIPVPATGDEQTRRILLDVLRQLEAQHRCRFNLDVLPAVLEVHRRYDREAAFPGKAARFCRQLAAKHARAEVTRDTVYGEFHRQTGLAMSVLDRRQRLDREDVLEALRDKLIGQEAALETVADVVALAKAGVHAPDRSLAVLLFVGPTGVGKTQCAKVLAEALYSDPARLLRFDMNEYVSPFAVARLTGTPEEPEGLLTGAVRRQPCAVVLLDEIEKAHADVFDLLLQVTGEGRLTDARGRTTDFTNTVIVMTSNLGTREAGQRIGLVPDAAGGQHVYLRAAESFFRPEFFNRIDRVLPFHPLDRAAMRDVAELQLGEVLGRAGLVRRRCVLEVDRRALERIVDEGFHPQFGARAIKRSIERQLTQPVAARLAAMKAEQPTIVSVFAGPAGVLARVRPMGNARPSRPPQLAFTQEELLVRLGPLMKRAAEEIERRHPAGSLGSGSISTAQLHYYALREQLHRLREALRALADRSQAAREQIAPPTIQSKVRRQGMRRSEMGRGSASMRSAMKEIRAAEDVLAYLDEATSSQLPLGGWLEQQLELLNDAALLHAMFAGQDLQDQVVLTARPLMSARAAEGVAQWVLRRYLELFAAEFACDVRRVNTPSRAGERTRGLAIAGPFASLLAGLEAGIHLACQGEEQLLPVLVQVLPRPAQCTPEAVLLDADSGYQAWLDRLARGQSTPEEDPRPAGEVIRLMDDDGRCVDVRSGVAVVQPTPRQQRLVTLSALPLPPELLDGDKGPAIRDRG